MFETDITSPWFIDNLCESSPQHQRSTSIALADEKIVGYCSMERDLDSRSSHVGNITIYVLPEFRHCGLGFSMMNELYYKALSLGVKKLAGKLPAEKFPEFRTLIEKLGFEKEAVLKDHIMDTSGGFHDVIYFGCRLEDLWELIADWQTSYGRDREH